MVFWEIDGWAGALTGLRLQLTLPAAFTPENNTGGVYDPTAHTLLLPITALQGHVRFSITEGGEGPFPVNAELRRENQLLAVSASLSIGDLGLNFIPASGGRAVGLGRRVRVDFPDNAMAEPLAVRVRTPRDSTRPPTSLSGHTFEVVARGRNSHQEIHQFQTPLTVELDYDEATLWGDESGLTLYYFDEENDIWQPLPSWVDRDTNTLYATTDHLTVFDYDITNWQSARLPSIEGFQVSQFTGAGTYEMPLWVPPGPGGLQPSLSLSYNSQVVDGANRYTQASWVGMGWSLDIGYIERDLYGTEDYLEDDTFSISMSGISGLLAKKDNNGNYRAADETFWQIKYDSATDSWKVWDKTGNIYFFGEEAGDRAAYPRFSDDGCSHLGDPTWRWALSKIRNVHGKELTFAYTKENKAFQRCGNPNNRWVDLAIYPQYINYPQDPTTPPYRVSFILENRYDYESIWSGDNPTVFFEQKRLQEVRIEHDSDHNGTYDQVIRNYVFTYETNDANNIFPGIVFTNNGYTARTLTLTQVQEYGFNGSSLTATTFAYADKMHLTSANNGYGGTVEYVYQEWHDESASDAQTMKMVFGGVDGRGQPRPCYNDDGDAGGWVDRSDSSDHSLVYCYEGKLRFFTEIKMDMPRHLFSPNGFYRIYANQESTVNKNLPPSRPWGTWVRAGLTDGITDTYGGSSGFPTSLVTSLGEFQIPASASSTQMLLNSDGSAMSEFWLVKLPIRYRVAEKKIYDSPTAPANVFGYTYDEPAMNDAAHSADLFTAKPYVQANTEGRGHAMVRGVGPDGRTTTTWFYQDDDRKGRAHTTVVGSNTFFDAFDTLNTGSWSFSSLNNLHKSIRISGDAALLADNPAANWAVTAQRSGDTLKDAAGYSNTATVQFRLSGTEAQAILALESGTYPNSNYRRYGVWMVKENNQRYLKVQYYDTQNFVTPVTLINDFQLDRWYVLQITIDNQKLFMQAWERDNPSTTSRFSMATPAYMSNLAYHFVQYSYSGSVWVDGYEEGRMYSFSQSLDSVQPQGSIVAPTDVDHAQDAYTGLGINWIRNDSESHLTFEGAYNGTGDYTGAWTDYQYNTTDQYGSSASTQFGNLTRTYEYSWIGTTWRSYRSTRTGYYPYLNNSVYLVGLPAFQDVYECSGGYCNTVKSSVLSLYDNQASFNTYPIYGKPTGQRTFVKVDDVNPLIQLYIDNSITYDAWGNVFQVKNYEQPEALTAYGSGQYQLTESAYDPIYHTYKISEENDLGHTWTWGYDYRVGLPNSETTPNAAVTLAEYDGFGRILKIARPGDDLASAPTLDIDYYDMSQGYPSSVVVGEKISGSSYHTIRKYYNGLGQLIQEQTAGALVTELIGGSDVESVKDVIANSWYDAYGRLKKQSMPYSVGPSSVYKTPTPDYPSTQTTYDLLGRPLQVIGTNGTPQITYSYLGLETLVTDARNNTTRSVSDVWGRTSNVYPPTGPAVSYTYDPLDRLVRVIRGGAQTDLTYDYAGRKTTMKDPDMGGASHPWRYSYDALGNLVSQTDARGCTTSLAYDGLNRLTGKSYSGSCGSGPSFPVTYSYDYGTNGIGHRTGMNDGSGSTTWFYDSRGRLIQENKYITDYGTYATVWEYYSNDALKAMRYPGDPNGQTGEVVNYTYQPQMALHTVTGDSSYVQDTYYDTAGRFLKRTLGNGKTTRYGYYAWTAATQPGKLSSIQTGDTGNSAAIQSLEYSYDAAGNVATIKDYKTESSPQTQSFTYDTLNRLMTAQTSGGTYGAYNETYAYDPATGRLSGKAGVAYTYGDANHFNAVTSLSSGSSYGYDTNGNMTTRTQGEATSNLAYDAENRLTGISGAASASYVYDGDGNRVKAVNGTTTTIYIGDYFEESYTSVSVTSPGFEDSNGWTTRADFPNTSLWRSNWATAAPHGGSYAYTISDLAYGYLQSNSITVTGGATYDLYTYVRGELDSQDSEGNWLVRAQFYTGATEAGYIDVVATSPEYLTADWTRRGGRFTAPSGATSIKIYLYNYLNSGWMAYDDVELKLVVNGVPQGSNLISIAGSGIDPGFESVTGWTPKTEASFPGTSLWRNTWGTAAPHSGSYAYSISNQAYGYLRSKSISITGGATYDLYTYVRGELDPQDSGGQWLVRAQFYDNMGHDAGYLDVAATDPEYLTSTWNRRGGRFTAPSSAASMKIYLYNYLNSGWVAYDDVEMKLVVNGTPQGSNLVSDPGFELNTGWGTGSFSPGTSFWRSTWGIASPHGGSYAYTISNLAYGSLKSDPIAVTAGAKYSLSTYLRGELDAQDSEGQWLIRAEFYTSSDAYLGYQDAIGGPPGTTSTGWIQKAGYVSAPAGAAKMRVYLLNYLNSGWMAFDDVSVKRVVSSINYYYAGAQRVAMRVKDDANWAGNVYYLLTDHLGSTSLTVDASGSKVAELRYKPWGETRYASGTTPTSYRYTGQREESLGLYHYGARMYDPLLGRFLSPDTIIPNPYDSQSWDRFAYVLNNPVRYNDPSGHRPDDGCRTEGCSLTQKDINDNAQREALWLAQNEKFKCQAGNQAHCSASTTEILAFVVGGLVTVGLAPEILALIDVFGWQTVAICSQSTICWNGIGAGGGSLLAIVAKARLQSLTNSANSQLGANPELAQTILTSFEYAAGQNSAAIARMQYGNAIERMVSSMIASSPIDRFFFEHVGGPSNPDFIGRRLLSRINFEITTPGQVAAHLVRSYGPGLQVVTYIRSQGFFKLP